MSDAPILVVGSVALDTIQTPFGNISEGLGGSASYFAFSASLFSRVSIVAVVGEDFPDEHRKAFEQRSIDLSGLETAEGRTFRWSGEYSVELAHAHTLETQLNVFAGFHPRLDEHHRKTPFVFLANIDPDLQLEVLRQIKEPKIVLSDTMNYWIARKPDRVLDVLRAVDIALLNEEEARALAGTSQLVHAAERLVDQGAKAVIIKKGEHGAIYQSADEQFTTPAFPVPALRDPTGAGDSFAGGFLGWLAQSGSLDRQSRMQALACGSTMASIAIEDFSPRRVARATLEEVSERLRTLHQMVHYDLELPTLSPGIER